MAKPADPTPAVNIFAMADALETNGRARLLPSLRHNGSAGASPSQARNGLGKVEENMFRGVASPSQIDHSDAFQVSEVVFISGWDLSYNQTLCGFEGSGREPALPLAILSSIESNPM